MIVNKEMKEYIFEEIIPQYNQLDDAHKPNHVYDVINKSLIIAKDYDVEIDMVYMIAAFHDLGNIVDRKTHHIIGGKMLSEDKFVTNFFNKEQIKLMKEAVEDHRASLNAPPRSIYGKIISEADRFSDIETLFERTYLYQLSNYPTEDFELRYKRILEHLEEKYSSRGYLKLWLETKVNRDILNKTRELMEKPNELREIFIKIHHKYTKE